MLIKFNNKNDFRLNTENRPTFLHILKETGIFHQLESQFTF